MIINQQMHTPNVIIDNVCSVVNNYLYAILLKEFVSAGCVCCICCDECETQLIILCCQ